MRSKKIPTLLLFTLLLAVILVGCTSKSDEETPETTVNEIATTQPEITTETPPETTEAIDPVKMFTDHFEKGEYLKAIDCYNMYMYGNINYEKEAERILSEYCENVNDRVLAGKADLEEVNNDFTLVYNITNKTNILSESEINSYLEDVEISLNSKAAYTAAVELFELKNWKAALESFNKVIQGDSNYTAAQRGIEQCTTKLKTESVNKAASLAQKGNYIDAIDILEELLETLTNDTEIRSKIIVYERTYINSIIEKAQNAFKVPAQDWNEALDIIEGALTHYPDNSSLLKEKNKYSVYAPVYLYELTPYKKQNWKFEKIIRDNTGIVRTNCLYYGGWVRNSSATYNINSKYDRLTLTIFSTSNTNYGNENIIIKGDGKVLFSKYDLESCFKPFDVEIDISNVSDLEINITASYDAGCVGIADAQLQKTK